MPNYKPGLHKVKVNTWGTKDKISNGLDNFVKQELFGGNRGHASIEMTLPITSETKKWIETYCMQETLEEYKATLPLRKQQTLTFKKYMQDAKKRIPVRLIETSTTLAHYNADGQLEKTAELASETSYYKIDFSFWPGDGIDFYLAKIESDMVDEQEGHHFEYSESAKEYLQPEERIHKGQIGSQSMTYAPATIAHQRAMSNKNFSRIELAVALQKIQKSLKTEEVLIKKVQELKTSKIDGSLGLICKNIGLQTSLLIKEFMEANPVKKSDKVDMDKFKEFFMRKISEHIADLEAKQATLAATIEDIDDVLDEKDYVTRGVPPYHTVDLPFVTQSSRGLNPEAMLKKMRELTEPGAPKFNLRTKNCSKTSIAILKAGTEHDPLLTHTVGEEALGFFGTPQQVLGNAQRAREIIATDKKNTLLTRLANSDMLNQAMGGFLAEYMKGDLTRGQKAKAIAGIVGIGILKVPEVLIRAVINPSQSISELASSVGTVFKNANSLPLKIGIGILSAIAMAVLAPFALIEKGLQVITAPFKAVAHWMTKRPPSPELDGQIAYPIVSEYAEFGPKNATYRSIIAGLVNAHVAKNISEHTLETSAKKTSAVDILTQFETDLKDHPDKVITLSVKDFDKLNRHVREKNDPNLTARFQACCEDSLTRANKLSPHKPAEVDKIVGEVTPKPTESATAVDGDKNPLINDA
ncbi:MAG: hypothetical protein ACHP65_04035, partial [Legionellales bacterium]